MKDQTKILHLISSLHRGGRERQLSIICANTALQNFPTKIVYYNKNENSYFDEYNISKLAIQVQSIGKLKRLNELHKILLKEKPDIVYSWGNGESVTLLLLKPFHRFYFVNGSVRHGIRLRKCSHYFRSLILKISPYVVANSKAGLEVNNLCRGHVLYNGIENKFLAPLQSTTSLRKTLTSVPKETPLFISVANLVPYKDYFSIFHALSKLFFEGYSFYYYILGDGPMRQEILNIIQEKGLSKQIKLVGNVENVSDYLKISDVFIHSSQGEGCSNAILEAMAAGLPIIASDTGGTSELVSKKNGWLFEYKNHEQLYKLVKYSIEHIKDIAVLGTYSTKMIRDRFTVDVMMQNYYCIIEKVMSK